MRLSPPVRLFVSIPLRCDWEAKATENANKVVSSFNSSKVRLGDPLSVAIFRHLKSFNSSKVRLGD